MLNLHTPTHLTEADQWLISQHTSGHRNPVNDRLNVILIRAYGRPALEAILSKRQARRTADILKQRKWQTSVSRRPQRGNHHDSWLIREQYVTGRYSVSNRDAELLWYSTHPEAFRPKWVLNHFRNSLGLESI